jgi:anti-sigma B factor antagonist
LTVPISAGPDHLDLGIHKYVGVENSDAVIHRGYNLAFQVRRGAGVLFRPGSRPSAAHSRYAHVARPSFILPVWRGYTLIRPDGGRHRPRHRCGRCEAMSRELSVDVDHHERPDRTVVIVSGDIDRNSSPLLRDTIQELIFTHRTRLVVDVGGITFCDSTGLRALLSGARTTSEAGGWLRLARVGGHLERLLRMTDLYSRFPIDADVAHSLDHTSEADPRTPERPE